MKFETILAPSEVIRGASTAASRPAFATLTKHDGTDVNGADFAAQELIRTELAGHTPGDGICREDAGTAAGSSGCRWIIDPIDGTAYFPDGIPLFASLITYEDEHGLAIGVINDPAAQRMIRGPGPLGALRPLHRPAAGLTGQR